MRKKEVYETFLNNVENTKKTSQHPEPSEICNIICSVKIQHTLFRNICFLKKNKRHSTLPFQSPG